MIAPTTQIYYQSNFHLNPWDFESPEYDLNPYSEDWIKATQNNNRGCPSFYDKAYGNNPDEQFNNHE